MKKQLIIALAAVCTGLFVNVKAQTGLDWAKQLKGDEYESSEGIAVDKSGNVYTVGTIYTNVDMDPGSGTSYLNASNTNFTLYLKKLDADGNFVWARQLTGNGWNNAYAMTMDKTGNIYICGNFFGDVDFDWGSGVTTLSTPIDLTNNFILKLDSKGDFLWARQFNAGLYFTQGPNTLTTDPDGNIFATGYFGGIIDFDPGTATYNMTAKGYSDVFVMKISSSGDFEWAKQIGEDRPEFWTRITADPNGNLYMSCAIENNFLETKVDMDPGAGTDFFTLSGYFDCFLLKLAPNGNYVWAKQIAGNGGVTRVNSFTFDQSANIYMTGDFSSTVDFDPGSNVSNLDSGGIFISKMDTSGNFIFAKRIGSGYLKTGTGIMVNKNGDIYTVGTFRNTMDADPGTGVTTLISNGNIDAFLIKLNASGQFQWAGSYGGRSNDSFPIATMDSLGQIYITGQFYDDVDFNMGSGSYIMTAQAKSDAYIMKLGSGNATGFNKIKSTQIALWPNPTTGIIQFTAPDAFSHKRYEIFNTMGQRVMETDDWINDRIDISNLPSGIYIINILLDHQLFNARVVKL